MSPTLAFLAGPLAVALPTFLFAAPAPQAAPTFSDSPAVAASAAPDQADPSLPSESPASVATLIHGGRIYLNDGKGTVVDALLCRDGRVIASGDEAALLERDGADRWRRLDLQGATAVPGLQDAHLRLSTYGQQRELVDLFGVTSVDEMLERVLPLVDTLEEGSWIFGRGWDHELFAEGALPHHAKISEAIPIHPVVLFSADGRSALVNNAALDRAKLDGRLDPPPRLQGGEIVRDEKRFATGVLVDAGIDLVLEHYTSPQTEEIAQRILAAQDELLSLGLTCVHDMDVDVETIDVLRELRDSGALRLRVVAYLDGNDSLSSEMLEDLPEFDAADRLSIVGVSLRVDGSLHLRGAAMIEEYADAPGSNGHVLLHKEDLARRVSLIAGARLQPAVQAVGTHANRMVLDVYQELANFMDDFPRLRPRIEYAQVVAPRDWPRFPALGVIPSVQPLRSARTRAWTESRLGADRIRDCDAWRRLAPELGRLAFGSDAPTVSASPVLNLWAARVRHVGDEEDEELLPYDELDGAAALAGLTSGPAYACHQGDRRGRLAKGYWADLTVLDVDPVTCDPDELVDAQVLMTIIDGRVVYRAGP